MRIHLRVLNLEDCVEDAELNKCMLESRWPQLSFQRVDRAEEFDSALRRGNIDLILTDYTMPGFGGQEALALARERCPNVPFLFVSGTIGEDTAIEALKNGATDYVLKHRLLRLIPATERALRETDERAAKKHAEFIMCESERKYRQVFECLGDAVFLADEYSGKIIDTNSRAETLLGCSRSEILGSRQSRFLPSLDQALESFEQSIDSELVRSDGTPLPVQIHSTRLTLYDRPLVLRLCLKLTHEDSRHRVL